MQTIIVDMTPGFRMPTIYYSQGDVGTQFAIDLRSRFGDSFPTGTTVTIQATKPSGFGFSVAATSVTNGVATFTTTAEMTDEFGRFPAELKVTKTGLTLFTANFYMDGERNTHPEGTTDGSQETVIPELTQLVERVEDAASSVLDMTVVANTLPAGSAATYSYNEEENKVTFGIPEGQAGSGAVGTVASAYSATKTYAVGDYAIQNGSLYRCTTAITTAESFTAAHWTQVVLGDDVSDLKSDLNVVADIKRNYFNPEDALSGYYYDGTTGNVVQAVAGSSFACVIFPVEKGKSYVLSQRDYFWIELDADNKILSFKDNSTAVSQVTITPTTSGVAKVAVSWKKATVPISDYMILDVGVSFSTYIPYPYTAKLNEPIIENSDILTDAMIDVPKENIIEDSFEVIRNYFNPEDAVSGYYYDGAHTGDTIGTIQSASYAGIIFPVEKGKTYVVSRTDWPWIELDENNTILSFKGNATTKTKYSITPNTSGVKKVALSWKKSNVQISEYMILDSGVAFNSYITYPYVSRLVQAVAEESLANVNQTYTVGQNGDFATFTDMLVGLKNNRNPKTVYVETGTYDIFDEMGGQAYIESISDDDDWKDVNNFVPPNTKIIGVGNVVLTYTPTQTEIVNEDRSWKMSPLNIDNSCHIENIKVIASNCRYAIHIERTGEGSDTAEITLRNVRAEWVATNFIGGHQVIGTGIGHNAVWNFEHCELVSNVVYPLFSVHTNGPDDDSQATIIMKDCVIRSTNNGASTNKLMEFRSLYLPYAITNVVKLANCYVNGKIATAISDSNVSHRQAFAVDVIGGASYGFVDSPDATTGHTIQNYGNALLS